MSCRYNSASHALARRLRCRDWRRALVIGLTAGSLGACRSDGIGPIPVQLDAAFALESVNGVPVPATVAEGGGQHYILLADTLRFSRDGSVARSLVFRHISATYAPGDTVYRYHMALPYAVTGERVAIGNLDPCPPNASCMGLEEGTITAAGLTVRGRLYWSGEPVLRFRRLPGG